MQIKVITKKVGEHLKFETVEHSLEMMHEKVGGWIESVRIKDDLIMWINEEGLLQNLPLNLITNVDGEDVHHIVGDVIFTGVNEEGDTISLTDEQMVWITNRTKIIGKAKEDGHFVFGLIF